MEVKKRELDEAMAKVYDECSKLRSKFHKEEEERCSPCEWKREDGDSYLKREAFERVEQATDEYYIQMLDQRTVRIPKDMIVIKDDNKEEYNRDDISVMKVNVKSLTETIIRAEKILDEKEKRSDYINTMKEMFEKYVATKYPSKLFDESKVIGTGSYKEGSMRINYTHDRVDMSYLGRRITHNGDYDFFVDTSIRADAITILNEVKQ